MHSLTRNQAIRSPCCALGHLVIVGSQRFLSRKRSLEEVKELLQTDTASHGRNSWQWREMGLVHPCLREGSTVKEFAPILPPSFLYPSLPFCLSWVGIVSLTLAGVPGLTHISLELVPSVRNPRKLPVPLWWYSPLLKQMKEDKGNTLFIGLRWANTGMSIYPLSNYMCLHLEITWACSLN